MAAVLAILAAFAFALGTVLQQKGTLDAPAAGDDPRFLVEILHRPVWLAGGALQAVGWVLQAAALSRGSLVVVQSLCTFSLVLALPLGARITHQRITCRVTAGALAVVVGIVLFLSVGSPQGGTAFPDASAWWSAGLAAVVIIVTLCLLDRHRGGANRSLLLGAAAGVAFGYQAAVTKVFVTQLGHGLGALVSSWTVYVLVATALVGFVLQQSALKAGVLAAAMASSNAMTLFCSVAFGITVFGETLSNGDARLGPALAGLGLALVGVVMLAGAEPPPGGASDVRALPGDEGPYTVRTGRS